MTFTDDEGFTHYIPDDLQNPIDAAQELDAKQTQIARALADEKSRQSGFDFARMFPITFEILARAFFVLCFVLLAGCEQVTPTPKASARTATAVKATEVYWQKLTPQYITIVVTTTPTNTATATQTLTPTATRTERGGQIHNVDLLRTQESK